MHAIRLLSRILTGLALLLGASGAHATATFDASAKASSEIIDVIDVSGASIDQANWGQFISYQSSLVQSDSSFDREPFPPNSTSTQKGASFGSYSSGVSASAGVNVSAPGFAEASAIAEREIVITNLTDQAIEVVLQETIEYTSSLSLDTIFQSLEFGRVAAGAFSISASRTYSPVSGPVTSSYDFGPDTNTVRATINASELLDFNLIAEAKGRISQVPAPATLALMSFGLFGLGYHQSRKHNKEV